MGTVLEQLIRGRIRRYEGVTKVLRIREIKALIRGDGLSNYNWMGDPRLAGEDACSPGYADGAGAGSTYELT